MKKLETFVNKGTRTTPLPTPDKISLFSFSEKQAACKLLYAKISAKNLIYRSPKNSFSAPMSYERFADYRKRGSPSSIEFAEDDKAVPLPSTRPLQDMAENNFDGPSVATTGSSKLYTPNRQSSVL